MYVRIPLQTCRSCGFQPESFVNACPRCGAMIVSPGRVRAMGWVLVVVGTLLTGGMAYLTAYVMGVVAQSDDPLARVRFTGDAGDQAFMFGVFGLVMLIGVVSLAAGVWQIRTGTTNSRLVVVMLMLASLFALIGMVVRYALT